MNAIDHLRACKEPRDIEQWLNEHAYMIGLSDASRFEFLNWHDNFSNSSGETYGWVTELWFKSYRHGPTDIDIQKLKFFGLEFIEIIGAYQFRVKILADSFPELAKTFNIPDIRRSLSEVTIPCCRMASASLRHCAARAFRYIRRVNALNSVLPEHDRIVSAWENLYIRYPDEADFSKAYLFKKFGKPCLVIGQIKDIPLDIRHAFSWIGKNQFLVETIDIAVLAQMRGDLGIDASIVDLTTYA